MRLLCQHVPSRMPESSVENSIKLVVWAAAVQSMLETRINMEPIQVRRDDASEYIVRETKMGVVAFRAFRDLLSLWVDRGVHSTYSKAHYLNSAVWAISVEYLSANSVIFVQT